jgi:predicted secreted protein
MATVSGQYGQIQIGSSDITECMFWSFTRTVADHAYASCSTGGYKKRIAGTKDGTGTMRGLQSDAASDDIETDFEEGDSVTLVLFWTATKKYTVPAIITRLHTECDIDDGAPVPWEADFGANGAWTVTH